MKFNTQNLVLVIVFQLMIAGATLYITETNAGADGSTCNNPSKTKDGIRIGYLDIAHDPFVSEEANLPYTIHDYDYLTTGEISEIDLRNKCKNYTKFRKIFRENIKVTHEKCSVKGDVCEYTGSAGCGINDLSGGDLSCSCDIEFTYCTQTSLGKKVGKSLKSRGKNEF